MISSKPYFFRAIYEWLLDCELTPYVMVDATIPGVVVPEEHVTDGQIILDIAPTSIANLLVDAEGVSFQARFSGVSRDLVLPMPAVLALYAYENGRGMVFTDDDDDDVGGAGFADDEDPDPTKGKPRGKPSLKIVK